MWTNYGFVCFTLFSSLDAMIDVEMGRLLDRKSPFVIWLNAVDNSHGGISWYVGFRSMNGALIGHIRK